MKHAATPPPAAHELFGHRLSLACSYANLLAGPGVERGLIGPREVDRIWERHILNSAVVAELIAPGSAVADVGSGAGLPGVPMVIARADLEMRLVEPMLRRTDFLSLVIAELGLPVRVVRGRAEDPAVLAAAGPVDVVVSRAVASLEKLTQWSLPLLRPGGRMLAVKGERAEAELEAGRVAMLRLGAGAPHVARCGERYVDPAATVVVAERVDRGPVGRRSPGKEKRR